MKIPAESYERIQAAVAAEATLHTDLLRDAAADIQVTFPTIIGLLGGLVGTLFGLFFFSDNPRDITGPLFVISLAILAVVVRRQQSKTSLLQHAYVSTTETFLAYGEEHNSNKNLTATQERQLQWLLLLSVMLERATGYVAKAAADPTLATLDEAQKVCCDILEKLAEVRHVCLRYAADDPTYNLHIFQFDPAQKCLVTFARVTGPGVPRTNRTWGPGLGHAGRCFEDSEMMCLPDLQGDEGTGYRRPGPPTDATVYHAILDAPIRNSVSTWGVLCITSGSAGQFGKSDFAPVTAVAAIIGVVIAVVK